jgi:hypothetical protein
MSIYDRLEFIIFGLGVAIRAFVVIFVPILKLCPIDAVMTVYLMALAALSWVIDNTFAY